ncbi:MAG: nucleotidyltransferase family protein [Caulobacteraceae bacterium]
MSDLEARLVTILEETPGLMRIMRGARGLALPDWMIFSGAIYQPVWNRLTGRPLEHGLKDYDLAYFDASDLSYEAEDAVIRRVAAAFEPPLRDMVEARNQARVHLWFEDHFGEAYGPLAKSAEALARFTAPAFAVGARLETDGRLTVFAPFGLDDLFALRLRPNPIRPSAAFGRTAETARRRWPEVSIQT